jgi:hypothetical protein
MSGVISRSPDIVIQMKWERQKDLQTALTFSLPDLSPSYSRIFLLQMHSKCHFSDQPQEALAISLPQLPPAAELSSLCGLQPNLD